LSKVGHFQFSVRGSEPQSLFDKWLVDDGNHDVHCASKRWGI